MKLTTLALTLLASMALSASAIAMPLSFDWEFTIGPGIDNAGEIVKGTIDGLFEGSNDGTGLTITITDTPTGVFEGFSDWTLNDPLLTGDAFTVTSGLVTFANVLFRSSTDDRLYFGGYGGGRVPEVSTSNYSTYWYHDDDPTRFTPHTVAQVPEPATLALFGLGLVALGASARRKKTA